MNLLAQNQPTQRLIGRVIGLLADDAEPAAKYYAHWYAANRAARLVQIREWRAVRRDEINASRRAKYAEGGRVNLLARARKMYATNKQYREAAKRRANARYAQSKQDAE